MIIVEVICNNGFIGSFRTKKGNQRAFAQASGNKKVCHRGAKRRCTANRKYSGGNARQKPKPPIGGCVKQRGYKFYK